MKNYVAIVLASGKGPRLEPLTRDHGKPAVPFGGAYRIVDFVLSNCLNSGIRHVFLLTQYKGLSLDRHINLAWQRYFCRELGEFIDILPPQHRIDERWYRGTADAVYQNIYSIEKHRPANVIILAGDHIYKMDYRHMVQFHQDVGADVSIGALAVKKDAAHRFGVLETDVHIPTGAEIGFDSHADRARGLHVTENGIVVVSFSDVFEPEYYVTAG